MSWPLPVPGPGAEGDQVSGLLLAKSLGRWCCFGLQGPDSV